MFVMLVLIHLSLMFGLAAIMWIVFEDLPRWKKRLYFILPEVAIIIGIVVIVFKSIYELLKFVNSHLRIQIMSNILDNNRILCPLSASVMRKDDSIPMPANSSCNIVTGNRRRMTDPYCMVVEQEIHMNAGKCNKLCNYKYKCESFCQRCACVLQGEGYRPTESEVKEALETLKFHLTLEELGEST